MERGLLNSIQSRMEKDTEAMLVVHITGKMDTEQEGVKLRR